MTIEDIAERSDVWRDSIEHILKNVKAIVGAVIAAGIGVWAFWPSGDPEPTLLLRKKRVLLFWNL